MTSKMYKRELHEGLNLPYEVVERLFGLFFSSIQTELDNLKIAVETGDMEEIYVLSHKISGSASNLRLHEIMNSSKEMEEKARAHSQENYSELYEILVDSFKQAKEDVEKETGSLA